MTQAVALEPKNHQLPVEEQMAVAPVMASQCPWERMQLRAAAWLEGRAEASQCHWQPSLAEAEGLMVDQQS